MTSPYESQTKRAEAFLADLVKVCKSHGLSLGHEDEHGGFKIYEYAEWITEDWMLQAFDETTAGKLKYAKACLRSAEDYYARCLIANTLTPETLHYCKQDSDHYKRCIAELMAQ